MVPTPCLVIKAQARYKRFLETKNRALFLLLFLIQVLYCRHLLVSQFNMANTQNPKWELNQCPCSWSLLASSTQQTMFLPSMCPFPATQDKQRKTLPNALSPAEGGMKTDTVLPQMEKPTMSTRRRQHRPPLGPCPGGGSWQILPRVRRECVIQQQSLRSCAV